MQYTAVCILCPVLRAWHGALVGWLNTPRLCCVQRDFLALGAHSAPLMVAPLDAHTLHFPLILSTEECVYMLYCSGLQRTGADINHILILDNRHRRDQHGDMEHARPGPSEIVQGSKDAAKITHSKMAPVKRGLGAKRAHAKSQSAHGVRVLSWLWCV